MQRHFLSFHIKIEYSLKLIDQVREVIVDVNSIIRIHDLIFNSRIFLKTYGKRFPKFSVKKIQIQKRVSEREL